YGHGAAACFRDRMDVFTCDHGIDDGNAVELTATVRRFLGGNEKFWPFVRGGVGVAIARFPADSVTGLAIPFRGAGGIRVSVAPTVAVTVQGELALGFAAFTHSLGLQAQL